MEELLPIDAMAVTSAAVAGVAGALVARATIGRWRDRPLAFAAVLIASFAVLQVLSQRFLLPRAHRPGVAAVPGNGLLSGDWTLVRVDDSALSLSSPGPLTPQPAALPPDAEASTSRFSVSTWQGGGIHVAVSHVIAKPGVASNLNGAIEGGLDKLRQMSSGASLEETRRPWKVDGRSGVIVDLRIRAAGRETLGHSLFIGDGPELWQILILYTPEQTAGASVAARLIESARFDRPRATSD